MDTTLEELETMQDAEVLDTNGAVPAMDTGFATEEDFFSTVSPIDVLYVPELKRNVRIRRATGKEIDAYRQSITIGTGQNLSVNQRGMRAKLAVLTLANADGSRMFADTDIHRLGQWSAIVLERIFDRARKVNGLTETDTDAEEGKS